MNSNQPIKNSPENSSKPDLNLLSFAPSHESNYLITFREICYDSILQSKFSMISVRVAEPNDYELLATLGRRAFYEAFGEHNDAQDMQRRGFGAADMADAVATRTG